MDPWLAGAGDGGTTVEGGPPVVNELVTAGDEGCGDPPPRSVGVRGLFVPPNGRGRVLLLIVGLMKGLLFL